MLPLDEGWDYTVYKIYIVLGISMLLGVPLLVALIFGGRFPYADYGVIYLIGLTGWVVGILLYWWWVFLYKEDRGLRSQASLDPITVPSTSALKSLNRLFQAMVVHGGDVEEWRKARWIGKWPVLEFFGWLNILVLWIFGAAWASMLGIFPGMAPVVLPMGVLVVVVVLIARIPRLVTRSADGFANAYWRPLGLAVGDRPSFKPHLLAILAGGQAVIPEGPVLIEGRRRGRSVRIEILNQFTRTLVQGKTPNFVLHSAEGKLQANEGAPDSVEKAIKGLRKARRWRGIQVMGGAEGVAIDRKSHQPNMWLYDLWLAEHLLEKLEDQNSA